MWLFLIEWQEGSYWRWLRGTKRTGHRDLRKHYKDKGIIAQQLVALWQVSVILVLGWQRQADLQNSLARQPSWFGRKLWVHWDSVSKIKAESSWGRHSRLNSGFSVNMGVCVHTHACARAHTHALIRTCTHNSVDVVSWYLTSNDRREYTNKTGYQNILTYLCLWVLIGAHIV